MWWLVVFCFHWHKCLFLFSLHISKFTTDLFQSPYKQCTAPGEGGATLRYSDTLLGIRIFNSRKIKLKVLVVLKTLLHIRTQPLQLWSFSQDPAIIASWLISEFCIATNFSPLGFSWRAIIAFKIFLSMLTVNSYLY